MLNEVLGVAARFQQHLTRKFGITGGAPSPQLTPEIAPVFQLEGGPEGHILQSEYQATASLTVSPVAAQKSAVGLFNPVGSNIIVVVNHIEAYCNAASNILCGVMRNTTVYPISTTPGRQSYTDTRVPVDPAGSTATKSPAAQFRAANDPPTLPAPNLFFRPVLANVLVEFSPSSWEHGIVLAPGWAVGLYMDAVNQTLVSSVQWREVPLAQGEVGPF